MSKAKKITFTVLIALVLVSALAVSFFRGSLRPTLVSMAENYATREATARINECVMGIFCEDMELYESFVSYTDDTDGGVRLLSANSTVANILKARISSALVVALEDVKGQSFYIPVGNVINSNLFAGKGPSICVKILSVGAVTTDVRTEFCEAAINQTLHRIMLDVSVIVSVYVPMGTLDVKVTSTVPIAETVLVGDVPDAYTFVIENGNGIAGEINDYGASNFLG